MSVTSPTDNRPLPIGVTEGQQFMENHLQIFRSGTTANGLGGAINFSSEVGNKQPRNLFEHISDEYRELGLRRYRCAYFFNSHYTLSIPNLVVYVKQSSTNTKSHIAFSFGSSDIKGTEQTIATEFTDPPGISFNTAQARQQAYFLTKPLKPREWKAFWIREILDFDAQTTENNFFAIRAEAKDPIAITPTADFNMTFVGNMGCNSSFDNILTKMKARNPSAFFFLGNMSYATTGDCWINRISAIRPMFITFGAHDWYTREWADIQDDNPYPRIPPDWFWPTPEEDCGDDRYEAENNIEFVEVSEKLEDENDPDGKKVWRVIVYDKVSGENGTERGEILEEYNFGDFPQSENNARSYSLYLRECEFFTNDVDRDRFNESLQNQYRNRFGLNTFEGFQAYYIGNIFVLILNSNAVPVGHVEDSPQYQFAARQLKAASDNAYVTYKIVITYRPGNVAPNGSLARSGEIRITDGYYGPAEKFNRTYKPLFEENNVTFWINGNVNNYQRTGILKFDSGNWFEPTEQGIASGPAYKLRDGALEGNGIIYLTVGTGGRRILPNDTLPSWVKKQVLSFGYLLITSVGNGMTLECRFYDGNDQLQDFFSVSAQ
jgi:hypothetical protein